MNNLILTTAVGYNFHKIEIFIKSLRKFYDDEIVILINKNQTELKFLLNDYRILFLESNIKANNAANDRFNYYYQYLKDKFNIYNFIFLSDSRDVFFQANPFIFKYKSNLNFYLEDNYIENCKHNSAWIKKTVGNNNYEKIKKNQISCSGTVFGKSEYVFYYIKLMQESIIRYKYKKNFKEFFLLKRKYSGYDQGIHNYLVYNNFFKEFHLYKNTEGNIATINYYSKKLTFNSHHQLVNSQGRPYDVVHQYDRPSVFLNFRDTIESILI